jgi:3,4-dihydroxy 2-butanone 4-phosphate synthase/GTP cyclohydrolase II
MNERSFRSNFYFMNHSACKSLMDKPYFSRTACIPSGPEWHERKIISPIEDIIADARRGKMFILVDDPDRENEGDLVILAEDASSDAVNFMARFGRGLICLALSPERASALDLELMPRRNVDKFHTAFTMTIDAREGTTTGISAADRSRTIRLSADANSAPGDFVTPGHVFPLIAKAGGVLDRRGHTEAAVDIALLAGRAPAAVICEILNDDGTMARLADLAQFAAVHNLKIGTINDLVHYRQALLDEGGTSDVEPRRIKALIRAKSSVREACWLSQSK